MKHAGRILAILLCVLILLCSMAGCKNNNGDSDSSGLLSPQDPVTITLWHYYVGENQQSLDKAVDSFNQSIGIERGIVVETIAMGSISELEKQVTDSAMGVINSNPMPNIFSSYPDKALEIAALNQLADIGEYLNEEEKSLYVQDFLEDYTFDGKLLLVPIVKSTELLYVNLTLWQEFADATGRTVDDLATWEKLAETSKAYYEWHDAKTPDIKWDGKGLFGFDSSVNFVIAGSKQLGFNVIDSESGEKGAALLKENELRRIFDIYYINNAFGYFDSEGSFRSDDIKTGKLAAFTGSSSGAAYFPTWLEQDGSEIEIDFLPLPYPVFENGSTYAVQQGAGMCMSNGTPRQKEASAEFLKWFTSREQNTAFAMNSGYLPIKNESYISDDFERKLTELRAGNKSQQNVAGVYEIALKQVLELGTYAARPFTGSYSIRKILESTLESLTVAGEAEVREMQDRGMSEEDILSALDLDAKFDEWIEAVKSELNYKNIPYMS